MRILVAYDGSDAAAQACRLAGACEWPDGSEITVLTAFQPFLPGTMWPTGIVDAMTAQTILDTERETATQTAQEGADLIRSYAASVTPEIVEGRAASAILDVARRDAPDLLVVGTRGLGPFRSTLLGSVSTELVEHAACPVLVARGDTAGRVILAYDDLPAARCATSLVASWPMFKGADTRVVTIAEKRERRIADPDPSEVLAFGSPPEVTDEMRRAALDVASRAADVLKSAGIVADVDVRFDHAAHGIVTAASEWHADLIVMGRSGHGLLEQLLLGSVARGVLQHAPCSVLVVHPPEEAKP